MASDGTPAGVDTAASDAAAETRTHEIRRRVFLATVFNVAGKVCTLGTWFLLTPFMLRQLGDSAYGLWILVSAVVAYGSLLDLGIGSAVTKYVAEHRARGEVREARIVIATSMWLYSGLGLLALVLSAALAPILPGLLQISDEDRRLAGWLVLLLGASVGVSMPFTTAGAVLRGLQRYGLLNALAVAGTMLTALVTVVTLHFGGGLLLMTAGHVVVTVAVQAVQAVAVWRVAPELVPRWSDARRAMVGRITHFTVPIFVIQIAGQLQSKTDSLVIGLIMPVSAIAPFSIALKLSELTQIVTDQFVRVLLPLASELHAEDDAVRLRHLLTTATRLTALFAVSIGSVVVVHADALLTAWVGAAYADYGYLVLILTAAVVLDTLTWPAALILQGMGRHRPLALSALGTGVANLVLSLILGLQYGLAGVALGTLIPAAIETVGIVIPYAMWVMGVRVRTMVAEVVLPLLVPTLATVAVLALMRSVVAPTSLLTIAAASLPGGLVFGVLYLALGAREHERALLRRLIQRALQNPVRSGRR